MDYTNYTNYHKIYKQKYYKANRDKILSKFKVKVTCECGSILNKYELARHKTTKLHQKKMLLV